MALVTRYLFISIVVLSAFLAPVAHSSCESLFLSHNPRYVYERNALYQRDKGESTDWWRMYPKNFYSDGRYDPDHPHAFAFAREDASAAIKILDSNKSDLKAGKRLAIAIHEMSRLAQLGKPDSHDSQIDLLNEGDRFLVRVRPAVSAPAKVMSSVKWTAEMLAKEGIELFLDPNKKGVSHLDYESMRRSKSFYFVDPLSLVNLIVPRDRARIGAFLTYLSRPGMWGTEGAQYLDWMVEIYVVSEAYKRLVLKRDIFQNEFDPKSMEFSFLLSFIETDLHDFLQTTASSLHQIQSILSQARSLHLLSLDRELSVRIDLITDFLQEASKKLILLQDALKGADEVNSKLLDEDGTVDSGSLDLIALREYLDKAGRVFNELARVYGLIDNLYFD